MPPFIKRDVPLAPYTTLGIGGSAGYFASIRELSELEEAIAWAESEKLPRTVLGGGSNVLIADNGISGLVLHMELQGADFIETEDAVLVTASSGMPWDEFVSLVTEKGLWGIENLSGIPGSVGATPVQNINAYGVSVGDSIDEVHAFDTKTQTHVGLKNEACRFGYRDSLFKSSEGKHLIITSVVFRLSKEKRPSTAYRSSSQSIERMLKEEGIENPTPHDIREAVRKARKNIGMLPGMFRSAGSFFKNVTTDVAAFERIRSRVAERHTQKDRQFSPWHWELPDGKVKVSTAFLMECTPFNKTDFKDSLYHDTVGISPLHTLSIVNANRASASDVRAFAERIVRAVEDEFGVTIEREVCYLPE